MLPDKNLFLFWFYGLGFKFCILTPNYFVVYFMNALTKVFATPEASIGFHTDCGFSHILSHLPGGLGKHKLNKRRFENNSLSPLSFWISLKCFPFYSYSRGNCSAVTTYTYCIM
jgi:hypothetical protein